MRRIRITPTASATYYGDSKLQGENGLLAMQAAGFRVVILYPPMIYGKGSRGNDPLLSHFAKKLPFFPAVNKVFVEE